MKKLKMIVASLLCIISSRVMAQQYIELSKYNNQKIIIANKSITLKPGFIIPAGAQVDIHVDPAPGVNIGTHLRSDVNAIVTYTPTSPGLVNAADSANGVNQVRVEVQTYDHLGKMKEIQQVRASPLLHSLAYLKEYDALGREVKTFLPYVEDPGSLNFQSSGYSSLVNSFYLSLGSNYAIDTNSYYYSGTRYETQQEPFVREKGAPGAAYTMDVNPLYKHTMRYEKITQPTVRFYRVKNDKLAIDSTSTYLVNDLAGLRTADENVQPYTSDPEPTSQTSGSVVEFKDFRGLTVLRRIDTWTTSGNPAATYSTYYVYDDHGNLRFVLPPKTNPDAVALMSQDWIDNVCYQYRYDTQDRMIAKRIPGKGWEYMIYNHQGQVVMTQDSMQRVKTVPEWNIIKYDAQGRVIITGIYAQSGSTPTNMQQNVNTQGIDWETRTTGGNGYTSKTYPQSWTTTLSVNYYDDYDLPGGNPYPYSGSEVSNMTRGMATASQVNVLGTGNMLWTVNYYDDEGHVVKTFKQHYKSGAVNTGNYDEISNTYNFTGALLSTTRSHKVSGTEALKSLTEYTYDTQGRKLDTWETINTGARTLLSRNDYDELGNLFHKKLHSTNGGSTFLQTITYHYNSRGWIDHAQADKFDLKLRYDNPTRVAAQYNGNIAEMEYTGVNTGNRQFSYYFDAFNRLIQATDLNGTTTNLSEQATYDENGNIATLYRNGANNTYVANHSGASNQLDHITNGPLSGSFTYDGNGNELTDSRRGLTLTYNQLNLPATVSGTRTASYLYDASGTKLKSFQMITAADTTTREYISGIQYTHGAIDFVQTDEGIAVRNAGTGVYKYLYNLKDHLGNTRVTIDDNGSGVAEVTQEDEYYAFGLDAPKFRLNPENKYLYNGKEKQDVLSDELDYGARFYDPVIARWTQVDPLAETSRRWSPYNYGKDNPIRNIDPDGMEAVSGDAMTGLYNQYANFVNDYNAKLGIKQEDPDKKNKQKEKPKVKYNYWTDWRAWLRATPIIGNVNQAADDLSAGDYWNAALHEGAGIIDMFAIESIAKTGALAFKSLTSLFTREAESTAIQFGGNANAYSHAIRHLQDAGFSEQGIEAAKIAVRNDVGKIASQIKVGAAVVSRIVNVNGVEVTYNAFKLSDGTINIGRMTVPR